MSVEHDASVCGDCRRFVAMNNLSLALFLGNCLLGEVGLYRSLGQLCNVSLRLLTSSLMASGRPRRLHVSPAQYEKKFEKREKKNIFNSYFFP
jgi:hypothetical protein